MKVLAIGATGFVGTPVVRQLDEQGHEVAVFHRGETEADLSGSTLQSTILRLPAVYGPENEQHRLRAHLQRMVDERPFILLGEAQAQWRWTHGYVENVAAAIALAVTNEQAAGGVYNVGERETPTEAQRVRKLAEIVGWGGEVIELPHEELPDHLQAPFDWQYELATNTSRIRDELGYSEPVSWEKALGQTVA